MLQGQSEDPLQATTGPSLPDVTSLDASRWAIGSGWLAGNDEDNVDRQGHRQPGLRAIAL